MSFYETSSFTEYLRHEATYLIPPAENSFPVQEEQGVCGTTIVALKHTEGVLLAADRRATMGNVIASSEIEKIFIIDDYTAIGFAGTVGIATELIRLFSAEIEHYEKIEGKPLSFAGKANKLAQLIRFNFSSARQGLIAIPLIIGMDYCAGEQGHKFSHGNIVSFDVIGGQYRESHGYRAIGSGAVYAQSSLKRTFDESDSMETAIIKAIVALEDAAENDSATGGINRARGVYPLVININAHGASRLEEDTIIELVDSSHFDSWLSTQSSLRNTDSQHRKSTRSVKKEKK